MILIVSVAINVIFFLFSTFVIYQKGGISYIKSWLTSQAASINTINATHIQRASLFKLLPIDNNDIVFIGDSITQRNEWSELFNNQNIKNRGIDSDTTSDVIDRLDEVISGKPDKIFIMVGVNDLQKGVKIDELLKNYKQILSKVNEYSPNTKVYVQSILPVDNKISVTFEKMSGEIVKTNEELEKIVNSFNGYRFINLFSLFLSEDNRLKSELTVDGIHLTGDGYLIWKKEIEQYVNE